MPDARPKLGRTSVRDLGFLRELREELVERLQLAAQASDATPRALWDWHYVQSIRNRIEGDRRAILVTARRLAIQGDAAGQFDFLRQLLMNRPVCSNV